MTPRTIMIANGSATSRGAHTRHSRRPSVLHAALARLSYKCAQSVCARC